MLVEAVLESVERIAMESKHPEVVMFENLHRLEDHLRRLNKIEHLKPYRPKVQQIYRDQLTLYVKSILGLPLERLKVFFDGVERLIASGVAAHEVGFHMEYNKAALRKSIAQMPARDVKKGLADIYKRVERHLCEEEHLQQVSFLR